MAWLHRTRWLVVPIAAYIAITLALPALHGAARRADFIHHAALVLAGCAAVIAVGAVAGVLVEIVTRKGGRS